MASPINVGFDLENGETVEIPLNRWGLAAYSLMVTTGTVALMGTITQINRRDRITGVAPTGDYHLLIDDEGTSTAAVPPSIIRVNGYPLTAVEITSSGASTGRFMQQGLVD